ncbi:MAG: methyltransferase [Flavobacterium nitrogenifigens]|uniref:Methyltransferase small domain-containing protein n=1 Tax=Flavobacterium nitrogenifigens TaxID=1617283 RepID=A0A521AEQ2_9FLAO|nr:methyltransferase [Flavobacterium nitrogenifigens]KAF2331479.1 methyltransferase [Flavobacterium nitrogenifigens]MDQ8012955.1 methyltransferase [Flavobacterium nitrogenifigens]SMO33305.1 Methyltransferase small domain-containing protein [Flavobacterium nitrogenifigens]
MSKLTKKQIADHNIAVELLKKDSLTFEEKLIVYEKWNESANSLNSEAGAFFTPIDLARDFSLQIYEGAKIVDMCAGIGMLSFFAYHYNKCTDITCVELNPQYVEVGKKLLPEAKWICGSIFDFEQLEHYDQAIGNPPFGKIKTGISTSSKLKYKGSEFDLITIEIASLIADCGAFIVPQMSTPFRYSGCHFFEDLRENSKGYNPYERSLPQKVQKFINETKLNYEFNIGIDTSVYINQWKGVSPMCEIITFDFTDKK